MIASDGVLFPKALRDPDCRFTSYDKLRELRNVLS